MLRSTGWVAVTAAMGFAFCASADAIAQDATPAQPVPTLAQPAPTSAPPAADPASAPADPAPVLAAPVAPALAPPPDAAAAAPAAGGSSCDKEFGKLANARVAQIGSLNALSKGKKGKLDPVAACSRLQALGGIEARMIAYVEKNKDWCGIPDSVEENIKKGRQSTAAFAAKACNAAVQYRKALANHQAQQRAAVNGAQQQGAAPARQPLPAGPL